MIHTLEIQASVESNIPEQKTVALGWIEAGVSMNRSIVMLMNQSLHALLVPCIYITLRDKTP